MVVRRRKKVRKLKGSRTHGWGSPKKHRGAGSRGGKGRAGLYGKKGQQRSSKFFSKGFERNVKGGKLKRHPSFVKKENVINVGDIEKRLDEFLKRRVVEKKGDLIQIDVSKLGYVKVLGGGTLTKKLSVSAEQVSKRAKEKIEKLRGVVVEH